MTSLRRIVFLGAPGAGKGTQAGRLAARLRVPHLSTGEIIRTEITTGTSIGESARSAVESGMLLSDELVTEIVKTRLSGDGSEGFVLDGFPRTLAQAQKLDDMLARRGHKVERVILLEVDVSVIEDRLRARSKIENRSDDNHASILRRLSEYELSSRSLAEYYEVQGCLRRINGNATESRVASEVRNA